MYGCAEIAIALQLRAARERTPSIPPIAEASAPPPGSAVACGAVVHGAGAGRGCYLGIGVSVGKRGPAGGLLIDLQVGRRVLIWWEDEDGEPSQGEWYPGTVSDSLPTEAQ
jgi:hypothetical protein